MLGLVGARRPHLLLILLILEAGPDLWSILWQQKRIMLFVRSDSVSALTLLLKMKCNDAKRAIIGRELALELGDCTFRPHICSHIPGLQNDVADQLSRHHQPGSNTALPEHLQAVRCMKVPTRTSSYYSALDCPSPLRSAG